MDELWIFVVNHWMLFAALAVILGLLLATTVVPGLQGIKGLDPLEATQLINHQGAVMLDIREDAEYQQGHILNSVHIPLPRLQQQLKTLEKHKAKPVIAVCQTGNRSAQAASLLHKNGFETVYNLRAGSWFSKTPTCHHEVDVHAQIEIHCSAVVLIAPARYDYWILKGVTYEELRVDVTPLLRDEMEERSGSTTVPPDIQTTSMWAASMIRHCWT
jgi:rhodanese-related sulfurtransferase